MNDRNLKSITTFSHDDLFSRINLIENLLASWQKFSKGKIDKPDVLKFSFELEKNLFDLHYDLKNNQYRHGYYSSFCVCDPKLRHIHKASVKDRVLHHAIMRIIEPIFDKIFIFDSYSSRKGKGVHKAILRLKKFAWKLSRNNTKTVWILKCDIRKFFDSIDHEILFRLIKKEISNQAFLELIKEVIDSYPFRLDLHEHKFKEGEVAVCDYGIPLGNLTSQLFSNVYLNPLDHFVKRILKERYYLRYADDFVILSHDRYYLENLVLIIRVFLVDKLKLKLHPNKIILRKWNQGVDFLGYVMFPHHTIMRPKTKRRMLGKIKNSCQLLEKGLLAKGSFNHSLQSYLGMLKHCFSYSIEKEIKNFLL